MEKIKISQSYASPGKNSQVTHVYSMDEEAKLG
jgi:hypothetical protein